MASLKKAAEQSYPLRANDWLITDGPFNCGPCGEQFEAGDEVVDVRSAYSSNPRARETIHLKCFTTAERLAS